jgi:hypothetical protein
MPINIPIEWNDEVGELFDKITLFTLKDALDIVQEQQADLIERLPNLPEHEAKDYFDGLTQEEALKVVIKYFGG